MEEKMSGLVLGGVNYSENDKILNVFTLEKGVVSAKIKGVKKAGAKLKFASEPFCFAEFVFSATADKRTVIGASLIDSFYPIREDIKKYFAGATVLEFIKKFYRESMVDESEFFLAINALKNIAYGDNPISSLVAFIVSALKEIGYRLSLGDCLGCGSNIVGRTFFDYRTGSFWCEKCFEGTGREINNITYQALYLSERGKLQDNHEGAIKALKLLDYYVSNRAEETLTSLKELVKIY